MTLNATYTNQYYPISAEEDHPEWGLSTRTLITAAHNINNMKKYVLNDKIIPEAFLPPLYSNGDSTSEILIVPLGRYFISRDYRQLMWWICSKCSNAGDYVDWKLWASTNLYVGPEVFDSSYLYNSSSSTIRCTSTDHEIPMSTLTINYRDIEGFVWLYLTATNEVASSYGNVYNLDVQPRMV